MSGSIFRKIIVLHVLLFAAALALVEFYITSVIRETYIENLTSGLLANIRLIENDVRPESLSLDEYCSRIKAATNARVTIIAADGRVTGDSDHPSAGMDNHLGRIEIMQAAEISTGSAIRHSGTLDYAFLYVAKRIERDGQVQGFIRLAVPLMEVDASVNRFRFKITGTVGGVLFATLALSIFYVTSIRAYLSQIRGFSHSLASGAEGQKLYVTGAREFEDITDDLNTMSSRLHAAFSSIQSERNRLGVILASLPDALLIIDTTGAIQLASRSASGFFSSGALAGRQYLDVVRNHDIAGLVDRARESAGNVSGELTIGERHLVARISPLFLSGSALSGFVIILHDITGEKRLEQVRKDFIANVSHELKTPVTAIKGFTETLLNGALEDRENASDFLRTIASNASRMESLIDDLMTISRIELGVISIQKAGVSVHEAVDNVTGLLRAGAAAKGLTLHSSVSPSVAVIEADRDRLIQILTNLADNAIKFTEKGNVTIGSEVRDGSPCIFVSDTGIGVVAKHLPRLGERFYRVDPGRSRKMGGTGLGLSIVKHLVRAHGWGMSIESTEGRGTTVYIMIRAGSGRDLTQS